MHSAVAFKALVWARQLPQFIRSAATGLDRVDRRLWVGSGSTSARLAAADLPVEVALLKAGRAASRVPGRRADLSAALIRNARP
jgi:hypothetical protein